MRVRAGKGEGREEGGKERRDRGDGNDAGGLTPRGGKGRGGV